MKRKHEVDAWYAWICITDPQLKAMVQLLHSTTGRDDRHQIKLAIKKRLSQQGIR